MLHRDKILAHAAQLLVSEEGPPRMDAQLAVYKRFLKIEEHRLRLAHRAGASGLEVSRYRAELLDVFLQHLYETARQTHYRGATAPPVAQGNGHHEPVSAERHTRLPLPAITLLATGGYGRGELNPFSDVDILFLHDAGPDDPVRRELDGFVKQILYLLWDVGFKVGHATRSIAGTIAHANADPVSKTSQIGRASCRERV